MNKFLISISFLLIFSLITSCSDDDETSPSETCQTTILHNTDNIITFSCDENNLIFTIDAITDISNSLSGTWPDLDTYRLFFDYDNNGLLDSEVDFMVSPYFNEFCYVNLITQTSTSGCIFFDDIIGVSDFETSSNLEMPHVQFQISIPKRFFSSDAKTNVSIHVRDSDSGWQYYPSNSTFFKSTYEIVW